MAPTPFNADTDGDTVSDGDEVAQSRNPLAAEDGDGDGLPDYLESVYGTDPNNPRLGCRRPAWTAQKSSAPLPPLPTLWSWTRNGDGLGDGQEIGFSDPTLGDTDGDGVARCRGTRRRSTDPWGRRTIQDGLTDYEAAAHLHPTRSLAPMPTP